MIAICTIREQPEYRRYAFVEGLKRAGYTVVPHGTPSGSEDLLVLWNYHPATLPMAADWEKHGGTVVVCENGYAGKDELFRQYYAIAVHGHNGSGWFPVGMEDRFARLGIEVLPWRKVDGGYALVCGQRGIGSPQMASPPGWHDRCAQELRKVNSMPIKVRPHPGNNQPPLTRLDDDLTAARACVIWSSSSGIRSLLLGVPVLYDAPHWICAIGAAKLRRAEFSLVEDDARRLAALRVMAWGQRSVAEIESGEPFVSIRENIGQAAW